MSATENRRAFPERPLLSHKDKDEIEAAHEGARPGKARYALAAARIALGWVFLWAFLDKLFGLGFATKAGRGWIDGGSPTDGFLKFAASGPFAGVYQAMAGSAAVEWLFMMGLLGIGVALILGIGMRIAAASGVAMMALMYLALLYPENNPVVDDHVIYAVLLLALAWSRAGRVFGLGAWWAERSLVKRYPILE